MLKSELNIHDPNDSVWSMTKMWQDKDMTDHTGSLYTKNESELLW